MTENSVPSFSHIKVTCDGRRATLTLDRPDSLNSLTNEVMAEIIDAANWFDHQPDLRVVIVSGEGRAFCSGFNVTAFTDTGISPAGGRVPADTGRLMQKLLSGLLLF